MENTYNIITQFEWIYIIPPIKMIKINKQAGWINFC